MASAWFYSRDGKQFGPVSAQELRELALRHVIQPSDLVWKEGLKTWKPASKVAGLFDGVSPRPATPPPLPPSERPAESLSDLIAAPLLAQAKMVKGIAGMVKDAVGPQDVDGDREVGTKEKVLSPIAVGLAILFFFPLGFYLLWKHPILSHDKRWWRVGYVWAGLIFLSALAGEKGSHETTKEKGSDAAVAQRSTEETLKKDENKLHAKREAWDAIFEYIKEEGPSLGDSPSRKQRERFAAGLRNLHQAFVDIPFDAAKNPDDARQMLKTYDYSMGTAIGRTFYQDLSAHMEAMRRRYDER